MQLAHTFGTGGPEIELLIVAVALVVLGIVFFVRRTASPRASTLTVLAGVALGAGSFVVPGPTSSSAEGVGIAITSPPDGGTVTAGAPVEIEVDISGGTLTRSQDSTDPSAGHLHVFVDDKLDSMPTGASPKVELEPGEHTILVEFVDSRHVSYSPRVTDQVEVRARQP